LGRNAEFIDELIKDPVFSDMLHTSEGSENGHTHTHSHGNGSGNGGRPDRERDSAQEKVRSTLRSFVRDWSDLGLPERTACYTPCLEALERAFPVGGGRGGKRVLIPGCGLGRLAMEIAARGESRFMLYFVGNHMGWLGEGTDASRRAQDGSTLRRDY
jgi:carnosine N-methyltransferase